MPIVDDDDLLVVRGERVGRVEAEVDAAVRLPGNSIDRGIIAIGTVEHRVVPIEHADAQAFFSLHKPFRKSPTVMPGWPSGATLSGARLSKSQARMSMERCARSAARAKASK